MNEYKQEKNNEKWFIGIVIAIIIVSAYLVTQSVIIIRNAGKNEKELYNKGYHDARTLYECEHDRTECEILKDTL